MSQPAVEPSVPSVDDHAFEAPEGRPWDRCRHCGLGEAAHLTTTAEYEPDGPWRCPDCVTAGVSPCSHE